MAYRLVIGADIPDTIVTNSNEKVTNVIRHWFQIDKCDSRQISLTSHICTQPMQNGEMMADHMYREPVSESISGTFSLNGKNWNDTVYENIAKGSSDRVTAIQKVFEYIKNNGCLCELTTFNEDDYGSESSSTRFLRRKNMVLENISWTEKQNSMDFNFVFKEVILYDYIPYEVDSTDKYLPNMISPNVKSLGQALVDYNQGDIFQTIIDRLYKNGYITKKFVKKICESGPEYKLDRWKMAWDVFAGRVFEWLGSRIGVIITSLSVVGIAKGIVVGSLYPVGTIIVGTVIVGVAVIGFIKRCISVGQKKKKSKKIIDLLNDSTEAGERKLNELQYRVMEKLVKVNLSISVVTIDHTESVDETTGNIILSTKDFETVLTVGNYYFKLSFSFDNLMETWNCKVTDVEGKIVTNNMKTISNISECESGNEWFISDPGRHYEIFLLYMDGHEGNQTLEEEKISRKCLNNYSIWISKGDDFKKNLKQIDTAITEILTEEGY